MLLGQGDGTLGAHVEFAAGSSPNDVVMCDLNGDTKQDLVTSHRSGVSVLLGHGNGTFENYVSYASPSPSSSVAVGDLNGDEMPDLVVGKSTAPFGMRYLL